MSSTAPALSGPAPELIYKRRIRPIQMARELWHARPLISALTEREFRARYKQTKMGYAWAFFTPLIMMVVLAVFFGRAANVQAGGFPYAVFLYVGMLPWTFFQNSLNKGGVSIISNMSLVNKVYCPREVFPLSAIAGAVIDLGIAATILVGLFAGYRVMPEAESVWVPVLMLIQVAFTIGVTVLLSALVVYLRDLRQVLPMILQFAIFAVPVMVGLDDLVAKSWQPVASALNPMAPVIDGYRRTILFGEPPRLGLLAIASVSSLVYLIGGYLVFKKLETGFADVA
ncbi:MAG TPA: ABC transporter permease [Acidimicrobiales bacterium]|jgi:ABC-2 type transport system permease protein/lipopolysaccharide transport system permease protein